MSPHGGLGAAGSVRWARVPIELDDRGESREVHLLNPSTPIGRASPVRPRQLAALAHAADARPSAWPRRSPAATLLPRGSTRRAQRLQSNVRMPFATASLPPRRCTRPTAATVEVAMKPRQAARLRVSSGLRARVVHAGRRSGACRPTGDDVVAVEHPDDGWLPVARLRRSPAPSRSPWNGRSARERGAQTSGPVRRDRRGDRLHLLARLDRARSGEQHRRPAADRDVPDLDSARRDQVARQHAQPAASFAVLNVQRGAEDRLEDVLDLVGPEPARGLMRQRVQHLGLAPRVVAFETLIARGLGDPHHDLGTSLEQLEDAPVQIVDFSPQCNQRSGVRRAVDQIPS